MNHREVNFLLTNIVLTWITIAIAIASYFYTKDSTISFVLCLLILPILRINLSENINLTPHKSKTLMEEYPKASMVAVFTMIMWLATISYRTNMTGSYKSTGDEISLISLPLLLLILHHDIKLFFKLKKQIRKHK